ncbi:hypothetical protein [Thalassospira mesophila]|uniref:SH3b domain-containing protein n=1 Tax=Thalassospira mesophila TaxID=1293891 RepID=A0A1Y2L3S5_9PROT|nr:hypothetical protein [Thalassospira mesophila]OSQ40486.1 hypothetical protein TMES_01475 [Thalassospira mesophila]
MKKLFIGVIVLGVIALGVWLFWAQQKAEQQKTADRFRPSPAQLYAGISDRISPVFDMHGYKVAMLVPGDRTDEDRWVFRGTARSGNLSPAYYGQVEYICAAHAETTTDCWKLRELVVDGRPLEISEIGLPEDGAKPDDKTATETRESQALGMNNALDTEDDAKNPDFAQPFAQGAVTGDATATSDPADDDKNSADASSEQGNMPASEASADKTSEPAAPAQAGAQVSGEVWRTTSNNVNARMGPGTDYEVAFAMPSTTAMSLLEQKNGWGRFSYQGPDGKTYRVWIYMSLVAKD